MKQKIKIKDAEISKGATIAWFDPNTNSIEWNNDVIEVMRMRKEDKEKYELSVRKNYQELLA